MQAFATLGDELCNGRILRRCFEQFQPALGDRAQHQAHLLLLHRLFRGDGEAELFVNRFGCRERLYCDTEMIDLECQLFPTFAAISSTSVYGSRLCSATSA